MSIQSELAAYCRKVYEKGFVSAYDGNLSVRSAGGNIFITRSGICKGEVTEKDILELDSSGNLISGEGKISTEYKIHLFVYSRRKDINAVVHCHPVYSTAFASAGKFTAHALQKNIFPEVILSLGKIPLCDYATPSTDELPGSMEPFIKNSEVFLLQNHGAVAIGVDIKDAYYKMEKLEHTAKTLFIARMLGGEKEISPEKVSELLDLSEKVYGIKKK